MPIYEFLCPNCGDEAKAFFKMTDDHEYTCPMCNIPMKKDYSKMIPLYQDVPVDSVDYDLTGDPIRYHTRGQLKRIAREHGCRVNFGVSHRNHGANG